MMQPANSLVRKDATASHGMSSTIRCSLPKSEMRSVFVVIADVFGEQPFEMPFVHCNEMIQ